MALVGARVVALDHEGQEGTSNPYQPLWHGAAPPIPNFTTDRDKYNTPKETPQQHYMKLRQLDAAARAPPSSSSTPICASGNETAGANTTPKYGPFATRAGVVQRSSLPGINEADQ